MDRHNKKRTFKLTYAGKLSVGLFVLIALSITTQLYIRASNQAMKDDLYQVKQDTERIRESINNLEGEINAIHEHLSLQKIGTLDFIDVYTSKTDVLVTNYWRGDGSSGDITASGLGIKDFDINDEGMFTYKNQIVLATANTERYPNNLNEGYRTHNLFDELTLTFNEKTYHAIVLDVCGACSGVVGESSQRYDVFTTGNVIGKVEAVLHE